MESDGTAAVSNKRIRRMSNKQPNASLSPMENDDELEIIEIDSCGQTIPKNTSKKRVSTAPSFAPPPQFPSFIVPKKNCSGDCACCGIQQISSRTAPNPVPYKTTSLELAVPFVWLVEKEKMQTGTQAFTPKMRSACGFEWKVSLVVEKQDRSPPVIGVVVNATVVPEWMSWEMTYKYNFHASYDYISCWIDDGVVETNSNTPTKEGGNRSFLRLSQVIYAMHATGAEHLNISASFEILKSNGVYEAKKWELQSTTNPMADVMIITKEGKRTAAPRQLMAFYSEFFRRNFYGGFRESIASQTTLKDLNHEQFTDFLKHILPGPRRPITARNIESLSHAAHYLWAENVKEDCDMYLCTAPNVPLVTKVKMAVRYELRQLKRQVAAQLTTVADIKQIFRTSEYQEEFTADEKVFLLELFPFAT